MLWLIALKIVTNEQSQVFTKRSLWIATQSLPRLKKVNIFLLFIFSKKIRLADDSHETLSLMFIQFVFSLKDNKSFLEYHLQHICLATMSAVYARIKSG